MSDIVALKPKHRVFVDLPMDYPPHGTDYNPDQFPACIFITLLEPLKSIASEDAGTRCTNANFRLRDDYTFYYGKAPRDKNWIEQSGTGTGTRITIRRPFTMDFMLEPYQGQPLRPVGIAFKAKENMAAAMVRGDMNIPVAGIEFLEAGRAYGGEDSVKSGIRIRNLYKDQGAPGAVQWGFTILVQGANGVVGMIDPDIENQAQD